MKKALSKKLIILLSILAIGAVLGFFFLDTRFEAISKSLAGAAAPFTHFSIAYFRYIGTDTLFSYLYVILIIIILYQWHVHRHIAYKPLFIVLSLSVTLAIVYCLTSFFFRYIPHFSILVHKNYLELLNDPAKAYQSGHIARLVAFVTCLYILFPKKTILLLLSTFLLFILIGVSLLVDNRYFISSLCVASMIGILVPNYIKNLIFVQRIFHTRSGLSHIRMG